MCRCSNFLAALKIQSVKSFEDRVLGDIPAATPEDVEVAVAAARRAFIRNKGEDWSKASGAVRAKYLRAIAAKVLHSNYLY